MQSQGLPLSNAVCNKDQASACPWHCRMHAVPSVKKNGAGGNLKAAAQKCNAIICVGDSAAGVLAPDFAMFKRNSQAQ